MEIRADGTGQIISVIARPADEELWPLDARVAATLEVDEGANPQLAADVRGYPGRYRLVDGTLYRDGQPVAFNPPGPDAVQESEAKAYLPLIETAISQVQTGLDAWPTLTATQKTAWIRDNFDRVLRILLGLLRMARWLARAYDRLRGM